MSKDKVAYIKQSDIVAFKKEIVSSNDPAVADWKDKDKTAVLAQFLIYATRATKAKKLITPEEFRDMRIAEINEGLTTGKPKTRQLLDGFMDYIRHTCVNCGKWIEGDPLDTSITMMLSCTCTIQKSDRRRHLHKGDPGRTLAPGGRNTRLMLLRGFLKQTIAHTNAVPFGRGENYSEYGWNISKTYSLTEDQFRKMISVSTTNEAATLYGWRQTGMSGDLSLLTHSSLVQQQLDDPNCEVLLIPWQRTKGRGQLDSNLFRYAAFVGNAVSIIRAIINTGRKGKAVQFGEPIYMGAGRKALTDKQHSNNLKNVLKKSMIEIPKGEKLGPHVFRKMAYSDYIGAKDTEFAQFMTGKKCATDKIVYWFNVPDLCKEIIMRVKDKMDPVGGIQIENDELKLTVKERDQELAEVRTTIKLMQEQQERMMGLITSLTQQVETDKAGTFQAAASG